MYKRSDGTNPSDEQVDELMKEYEEARKRELEFDPRKHRLKHGIRNYGGSTNQSFKGKGVILN